jgi:Raf kinase inhibitor-like YbhB/YbcL family protein
MQLRSLLALLALVILTAAAPVQSFHLNSTAFSEGQSIPRSYTYDGGNQIPPLNWWGEPSGTLQFVLVVFDPDAPRANDNGPFIHWLVYYIPEGTSDIGSAVLEGAGQAVNSFGQAGWNGPMPPAGGPPHHYIFALYALDSILPFSFGATTAQIFQFMNGHVLAEAILMGTYQRS